MRVEVRRQISQGFLGVACCIVEHVSEQALGHRVGPEIFADSERVEDEPPRAQVVDRHKEPGGVVLRGIDRPRDRFGGRRLAALGGSGGCAGRHFIRRKPAARMAAISRRRSSGVMAALLNAQQRGGTDRNLPRHASCSSIGRRMSLDRGAAAIFAALFSLPGP
jgi:hypothetical protein